MATRKFELRNNYLYPADISDDTAWEMSEYCNERIDDDIFDNENYIKLLKKLINQIDGKIRFEKDFIYITISDNILQKTEKKGKNVSSNTLTGKYMFIKRFNSYSMIPVGNIGIDYNILEAINKRLFADGHKEYLEFDDLKKDVEDICKSLGATMKYDKSTEIALIEMPDGEIGNKKDKKQDKKSRKKAKQKLFSGWFNDNKDDEEEINNNVLCGTVLREKKKDEGTEIKEIIGSPEKKNDYWRGGSWNSKSSYKSYSGKSSAGEGYGDHNHWQNGEYGF